MRLPRVALLAFVSSFAQETSLATVSDSVTAASGNFTKAAAEAQPALRNCTARERRAIAALPVLALAEVSVFDEGGSWLRLLRRALPDATVFVDVGFNKGFWAAEVLARWLPDLGVTPASWFASLKAISGCQCADGGPGDPEHCACLLNGANLCGDGPSPRCLWTEMDAAGAAEDARSSPRSPATAADDAEAVRPHVVAVDASKAMADLAALLTAPGSVMQRALALGRVRLSFHAVAVGSDGDGPVSVLFPTDGHENRGIGTCAACAAETVPLVSLEELLERAMGAPPGHAAVVVDVLKIDVEGAEPDILLGDAARRVLGAGRVRRCALGFFFLFPAFFFQMKTIAAACISPLRASPTLRLRMRCSLIFEVHSKGSWLGPRGLQDVVEALAADGFSCFLAGKAHLVELTRGCAGPELDALRLRGISFRIAGSNVYCAHKGLAPGLAAAMRSAALAPRDLAACVEALDPAVERWSPGAREGRACTRPSDAWGGRGATWEDGPGAAAEAAELELEALSAAYAVALDRIAGLTQQAAQSEVASN